MELRHIRYFLAIAEERNFTRAAARVGIGQPPLSQQIKDLENEVGTLLFRRLAQGVELTEAGRAFLAIVKDLPSLAHRGKVEAQRAARGEVGSLRVGFTDSAAYDSLVPRTIRAYRLAYPDVDLTIEEAPSGPLIKALKGGDLDVVFLRSQADAKIEGLNLRLAAKEALCAVLHVTHGHARADRVSLQDLREDAFILFHQNIGPMYEIVRAACEAAGFQPRIGPTASQAGTILTYVAAGFGVALAPASMQGSHVECVTFRKLVDSPEIALSIAWRRNDHSTAVRSFVSLVK